MNYKKASLYVLNTLIPESNKTEQFSALTEAHPYNEILIHLRDFFNLNKLEIALIFEELKEEKYTNGTENELRISFWGLKYIKSRKNICTKIIYWLEKDGVYWKFVTPLIGFAVGMLTYYLTHPKC